MALYHKHFWISCYQVKVIAERVKRFDCWLKGVGRPNLNREHCQTPRLSASTLLSIFAFQAKSKGEFNAE